MQNLSISFSSLHDHMRNAHWICHAMTSTNPIAASYTFEIPNAATTLTLPGRQSISHELWRAECFITKTYKVAHFMDKFRSYLSKTYDLFCCWLAICFLQYDLICPDSDRFYALRYDLSCGGKEFFIAIIFVQTAAKLVRKVGCSVSFYNDALDMHSELQIFHNKTLSASSCTRCDFNFLLVEFLLSWKQHLKFEWLSFTKNCDVTCQWCRLRLL